MTLIAVDSRKQTSATADTASKARATAAWTWRTRQAAAPLWCSAGALACGATAHALPDHWWGAAPVVAYGGLAAWRLDRDRSRGLARTRHAFVFHGGVTAAFGVWMIPATIGGLSPGLAEWAGYGLASFGGAWWLRRPLRNVRRWHRVGKLPKRELVAAPVAPAPEPPTTVEQLVGDWTTYLADKGPLAGVRLTNLEELKRGSATYAIRATLLGVRGDHTTARLVSCAETIRSGLDLHTGTILMDGSGSTGSTARLTVFLGDNPLRHLRDLPEPADPTPFGSGVRLTADIGEFADGQKILWVYYEPGDGAKHGIIAGDSGSGKGVATDKAVCGAVGTGQIVVLLLDPKDGRSSSVLPLFPAGGVAVTPAERNLLLDGIEAEHRRRNQVLAATPWTDQYGNERNITPGTDPPSFFTPTSDMPLILVILEEIATQTEDMDFAKRLGTLTREVRASGIGFVGVGQGVGTVEMGSATIRANLAQNVLMFRTKNALTGQRLGDSDSAVKVTLDPSTLFAHWPGTSESAKGLCAPAGLCAAGRSEPGRTYPNGNIVAIVRALLSREHRAALSPAAIATLGLDRIAEMRAARLLGNDAADAPASAPASRSAPAPADDARTRDLIVDVLRHAGEPMAAGAILAAMTERGRPVSPQNLGNHMAKLISATTVTRTGRGMYEAVYDAEFLDEQPLEGSLR